MSRPNRGVGDAERLAVDLSGRLGDADVVPQRLRHLAFAVGARQQRRGQNDLLGLPVGALDVAPHQQVELLIGAAQLDIGLDRNRVVALQQRVHQLEHRDRRAGGEPLGEVVTLDDVRHRGGGQQPEEVGHRHVEPLAVEADLQAVRVEYLQRLLLEGRGVGPDLLVAEHRPGRGPSAGVADARGAVTDDQHDRMAGVLELTHLLQHDREPRWMSERVGSIAQLDPQRSAEFEFGLEPALRQAVDCIA